MQTALATRIAIQDLLALDPPHLGNFLERTRARIDELAAAAPDSAWPPATPAIDPVVVPAGFAAVLVRLAGKEVGVHETGGENSGARIREYQSATNLPPDQWPWCAAFICWLVKEAILTGPVIAFKRPTTAGAWDFERWARDQSGRGVTLHKPKDIAARAGDLVVYTYSHIGLAVGAETAGRIPTIEGNTNADGGREGDGVYRKSRRVSDIRSLIRIG
ncbi:MAG: hypothetical protein QOE70_4391 [Chthoniobacter sp.]|jgi:hypothetical protein|nr:hypothetical protein [Chthoniobacter sp.]